MFHQKPFVLLFCLSLLVAPLCKSQVPTLDSNAVISVITCGPGNDFYTSFGHSAIRVCDTSQGMDWVYNYGTFDFDTPHFYLTFARGRLDYCLSRCGFQSFLFEYAYEGRAVWEQPLRLTPQEKQNLFLLLETNYLPEYRYYRYDFFRDNCATRIRDIVTSALAHRTLFVEQTSDTNRSYRQLLYPAMEDKLEWWRFAIDLLLGQRCDHQCSNLEYMFSPVEMMHQFDTTLMSDTHEPLAEQNRQLLPEVKPEIPNSVSPDVCFWFLMMVVVCLTVIGWAKGWRLGWLDVLLFGTVAIVALVLIVMWVATSHYCTKMNWNLLWASPLFVYFAIRLKRSNRWVVLVQLVALVASLVILLVGAPQQFNSAVVPIILTLFVRLVAQMRPVQEITNTKGGFYKFNVTIK